MIGVGDKEHHKNVLNRINSQMKEITEFISKIERTSMMSKKTVKILLYGIKSVLMSAKAELMKLNEKLKEMKREEE